MRKSPSCSSAASSTLRTGPWLQGGWSPTVSYTDCSGCFYSVFQNPQPCLCNFFKGSGPWPCFPVTFPWNLRDGRFQSTRSLGDISGLPGSAGTSGPRPAQRQLQGSRKEGGGRTRPAWLCVLFPFSSFRRGRAKTRFLGHMLFKNVTSGERREEMLWDEVQRMHVPVQPPRLGQAQALPPCSEQVAGPLTGASPPPSKALSSETRASVTP